MRVGSRGGDQRRRWGTEAGRGCGCDSDAHLLAKLVLRDAVLRHRLRERRRSGFVGVPSHHLTLVVESRLFVIVHVHASQTDLGCGRKRWKL